MTTLELIVSWIPPGKLSSNCFMFSITITTALNIKISRDNICYSRWLSIWAKWVNTRRQFSYRVSICGVGYNPVSNFLHIWSWTRSRCPSLRLNIDIYCTSVPIFFNVKGLSLTRTTPPVGLETSGVPLALEHQLSRQDTNIRKTSIPLEKPVCLV